VGVGQSVFGHHFSADQQRIVSWAKVTRLPIGRHFGADGTASPLACSALTIAFAFLIVESVVNRNICALPLMKSCRGKHSGRTTPASISASFRPFTQLAIQKFVCIPAGSRPSPSQGAAGAQPSHSCSNTIGGLHRDMPFGCPCLSLDLH